MQWLRKLKWIRMKLKKKWRSLRDTFLKEKKKVTKSRSGDPQECVEIYTGRWNYYNLLLFLKDTTAPRITEDNVSECEEERIEEDSDASENEKIENNYDVSNNYVNDGSYENISSPTGVSNIENPSSLTQSESSNLDTQITNSSSYSTNLQSCPKKKKKRNDDQKNFEKELLQIETQKLNALLQSNNTTTPIDDDDMLFLKSLHPYFKNMHAIQKLRIRNQFQNTIINELSQTKVQPITNTSTYNITHINDTSIAPVVTSQILRSGQFNEDYIHFDVQNFNST
ncbi:uncharacterized protein LOC112684124 [Sipha flava]|uniref:Uncharacterized protein LOC112684124 n=1 Tax=Sipha flava TaxID=143950 RepID=A0A8B8FLL8_9HEMI|nr:uncharacterized protein LOC112684124 [Sipha flava]